VLTSLERAVVGVRDLSAASERAAALLGRPPSTRGAHPGAGTANTLFRLENTVLELRAPEGAGPVGDALRARLARHGEGLAALAFATPDAARCAEGLAERGLGPGPLRDGEGQSEAGALRRGRTVALSLARTRGIPLFAIEARSGREALPRRAPADDPAAAVAALDHAVILCGDLEAGRALYGDALGLRLALDRRFEARGIRILFFRVGGVTLELVGGLGPAAGADGPDRFGGLAWRVPRPDAARERLATAGFDVSPLRAGAKRGTRVFTVRGDPCGVPTLVIGPEAPYGEAAPPTANAAG